MHQLGSLNWLAILVAAASGFVIGGLWYGPLFQKPWMRLSGMTKEKGAEGNIAVTFGGAYLLNLIAAAGIALLAGPQAGWLAGLHTGAFAALFFVATALGVIYLFERRPLGLWFINAAYQVVNFAAMGAIVGAWH
ncbi:MAG TPA: DUF1761 domain-containing protein [Steroidobacteraceae bacterium]|nr:DUF1761 domain-containing protein [Steroidobacteraceae bacterium]